MARGVMWMVPLCALLGGCSSDAARREDVLRRRAYELEERESRLRGAEQRFKQCVAERYPGEESGLEPAPGRQEATEEDVAQDGVLDPEQLEEVQRVARVGQPAVIACYTEELERRGTKKLEGSVLVKILIGVNGTPSRVVIGKSTLNAPSVHSCMADVIRNWEFPKLRSPAWYSTTFELSPAY